MGGVELQVQALAHALLSKGHEVRIATVRQPGQARLVYDGPIPVHRIEGLLTRLPSFRRNARRYPPPFPDPLLTRSLRRFALDVRPDVVQSHGWVSFSAAVALRGLDTRLISSVRDYGYACAVRTLLQNDVRICAGPAPGKCERCASKKYGVIKGLIAAMGVRASRPYLASRTDVFHAVSGYVAEATERDVLLEQRGTSVVVIPDIVISSDRSPRETLTLPEGPFVLFVGALQPHKGIGTLLDVYAREVSLPPLVLIGTRWPDTPTHWPPGILVHENVPHSQVLEAIDRAQICVVPSIWPDPLPGVVREIMSRGKPVIASRVGGIVDMIVDDVSGVLVKPGDVRELGAQLLALAHDGERRRRLASAAQQDAARFTPEYIAAGFESLYEAARTQSSRELQAEPKRILITGASGQGKTTLANRLGENLGVEVHHFDDLPREAVHSLAKGERWIAEGIQIDWTNALYEAADLVIWLDNASALTAAYRTLSRFAECARAERARHPSLASYWRPQAFIRQIASLVRALLALFLRDSRWSPRPRTERSDARAAFLARFSNKTIRVRRASDLEDVLPRLLQS